MESLQDKTASTETIGLLDIDGTLIHGMGDGVYNDNLIQGLINNNITNIYLFTSMNILKNSVIERNKLIEYLKGKGIQVLGVITDCDLGYLIDCEEKNAYLANPNNDSKEQLNQYLEINIYNKYIDSPLNYVCGRPFADAQEQIKNNTFIENIEKSAVDGAITSMLASRRNYAKNGGNKGIMYEMFMTQNNEHKLDRKYNQIVFCDDDYNNNLNSVKNAHSRFFKDSGTNLILIHVDNKLKNLSENYYANLIRSGGEMAKDRAYEEINNLFAHFIRKHSKDTKNVEVLKELQLQFEAKAKVDNRTALLYIQQEALSILAKNPHGFLNASLPSDIKGFCKKLAKMEKGDFDSISKLSESIFAPKTNDNSKCSIQ